MDSLSPFQKYFNALFWISTAMDFLREKILTSSISPKLSHSKLAPEYLHDALQAFMVPSHNAFSIKNMPLTFEFWNQFFKHFWFEVHRLIFLYSMALWWKSCTRAYTWNGTTLEKWRKKLVFFYFIHSPLCLNFSQIVENLGSSRNGGNCRPFCRISSSLHLFYRTGGSPQHVYQTAGNPRIACRTCNGRLSSSQSLFQN